jgi:hypothetical protein
VASGLSSHERDKFSIGRGGQFSTGANTLDDLIDRRGCKRGSAPGDPQNGRRLAMINGHCRQSMKVSISREVRHEAVAEGYIALDAAFAKTASLDPKHSDRRNSIHNVSTLRRQAGFVEYRRSARDPSC